MCINFNAPLVSIIIPTYERNELLPRALDSIVEQSWKNLEVIIADDNLSGTFYEAKTKEIINQYKNILNIVYVKTDGAVGGGAARNLALKHCSGEYIAFLDDDDRYLPNKIEKQLQFMLDENLDASYQDVKWYNSEEKLVEFRKMDYTNDYTREGLLKAHILHSLCPTSIYMFRAEKLLKTEGFGEVSSGQDFILMLRCIESGMNMKYMPGAYVIQYLHKGKRVSLGASKINGENNLYQLKHNYFYLLTNGEKKYVRFRHYAVLAFARARNHEFINAGKYAIMTFISSPKDSFKEAIRYIDSKRD